MPNFLLDVLCVMSSLPSFIYQNPSHSLRSSLKYKISLETHPKPGIRHANTCSGTHMHMYVYTRTHTHTLVDMLSLFCDSNTMYLYIPPSSYYILTYVNSCLQSHLPSPHQTEYLREQRLWFIRLYCHHMISRSRGCWTNTGYWLVTLNRLN